jgi:antitoxin ParD1/3/4
MNVSLTEKQEKYIASQIEMGDYQNASELVRDALRLHQVYRNRIIKELQDEIEKAWDSPISDLSVKDILAKKAPE